MTNTETHLHLAISSPGQQQCCYNDATVVMCQPPPFYPVEEESADVSTLSHALQDSTNILGAITDEDQFPEGHSEVVPHRHTVYQGTREAGGKEYSKLEAHSVPGGVAWERGYETSIMMITGLTPGRRR